MKLFKSSSKSKSISNEIQRIVKGISPFLTENIIKDFYQKIVSLIYDKNKKKYGR